MAAPTSSAEAAAGRRRPPLTRIVTPGTSRTLLLALILSEVIKGKRGENWEASYSKLGRRAWGERYRRPEGGWHAGKQFLLIQRRPTPSRMRRSNATTLCPLQGGLRLLFWTLTFLSIAFMHFVTFTLFWLTSLKNQSSLPIISITIRTFVSLIYIIFSIVHHHLRTLFVQYLRKPFYVLIIIHALKFCKILFNHIWYCKRKKKDKAELYENY